MILIKIDTKAAAPETTGSIPASEPAGEGQQ
jgi:hypothetical protein